MEEAELLPNQANAELRPHRFSASRLIGGAAFALVLVAVLAFSWRVLKFYRGIQSGEINPALAYTTTDFTRAASAFAAKAAANAGPTVGLLGTSDPNLGAASAKITVVEFADFGCPYSQEVAPIVRAIAKQYPIDVRLVFRNYPIDELHPGATIAAQGGGCANEQGKFWEYHDAVFAAQSTEQEISVSYLSTLAGGIGLNEDQFTRCIESGYYAKDVSEDVSDGATAGVVGTPTFFFNGQKVEGSIPFTIFNQIINAMRQT
jgi:protein-disulfide isomerase